MHSLRGVRVQRFRSAQVSSARYCCGYNSSIFYQIAKAFLIVAIYIPQFVKALQTLLSRSKSNRNVHMQYITWILLLER